MTVFTVVKTIGTTARQYSTLQAWEDASPANLTTAEKSACTTFAVATFVSGETLTFVGSGATGKLVATDSTGVGTGTYIVYDIISGDPTAGDTITGGTSTATCSLTSSTATDVGVIWQGQCYNDSEFFTASGILLSISGSTSNSTCYKHLTCAPGQSFRDHSTVNTNALRYDQSKGVGARGTSHATNTIYITESNSKLTGIQIKSTASNAAYAVRAVGANINTEFCILEAILSPCLWSNSGGSIYNCLFIAQAAGTTSVATLESTFSVYNSTFIALNGSTNTFAAGYGTILLKNCAFYGGTNTKSGSSTFTFTTCYSTSNDGLSGVAYATTSAFGFVAVTTLVSSSDFRLQATSALINTGTTDATNAAIDIVGHTRNLGSNTLYDIGCWEHTPYQTIVKTIGTTARDYSTLQAWEDAAPANLILQNVIWQGQCYKDSVFSSTTATLLTVAGSTSNATCYKELTTGPGQSFIDHATVATNPLYPDTTKGVSITLDASYAGSAVVITEQYTRLNKIQVAGSLRSGNGSPGAISILINALVDRCIASGYGNAVFSFANGGTLSNSLIIQLRSGGVSAMTCSSSGNTFCYNVTAIALGTVASYAYKGSYNTHTHRNCAYLNFTIPLFVGAGAGTAVSTTCYTDNASPPTGFTTLAFASAGFVNTASDFRLQATSALINKGTTDATNAPVDIHGRIRNLGINTVYDVGCWEYAPYQTIVKSIGTSGRDYSTTQAWEDAAPTNLVIQNIIWRGECYNDSEFTGNLIIGGSTADSSCYKHLTAAKGHSFVDNVNVSDSPLRYNRASGVGFRIVGNYNVMLTVQSGEYVKIDRLQYHYDSTYGSNYYPMWSLVTSGEFSSLILQNRRTNIGAINLASGTYRNCIFLSTGTTINIFINASPGVKLYNCTIARAANVATGTSAIAIGTGAAYTIKNCAIFGFTNVFNGTGTISANNCFTNGTTIYTGFNASTYAAAGFKGNTLENIDYRITKDSALVNAGAAIPTENLYDIIGTKRGQDTGQNLSVPAGGRYDVGCWEYVTESLATPVNLIKSTMVRTTQPQIPVGLNQSHPLASHNWTFLQASERYIIGSLNVVPSLFATAKYSIDTIGSNLDIVALGDYQILPSSMALGVSSGVLLVQVTNISQVHTFFCTSITGGGNGFSITSGGSGKVELAKHNVVTIVSSTNSLRIGLNAVAWSYNNSTGRARIAVNGIVTEATSAQSFSHAGVGRGRYRIGDTVNCFPHKQYLFAQSPNEIFSDTLLSNLTSTIYSLWQLFAPISKPTWSPKPLPGKWTTQKSRALGTSTGQVSVAAPAGVKHLVRTKQPQSPTALDRGSSLFSNSLECWLPTAGLLSCSGSGMALTPGVGTILSTGKYGTGWLFDGNANKVLTATEASSRSFDNSVWFAVFDKTASSVGGNGGLYISGSGAYTLGVGEYFTGGSLKRAYVSVGGVLNAGAVSATKGLMVVCGGQLDYLNSFVAYSEAGQIFTATGATDSSVFTTLSIGNLYLNGRVLLAGRIVNDKASVTKWKANSISFCNNPWQIFAPIEQPIYV